MTTWRSVTPPAAVRRTPGGWARICLRAPALALLVSIGLCVLLTVRAIERPLTGKRRPWSPHVTRLVCRAALAVLGIARNVVGRPAAGPCAMVANHASWIDIFALNAGATVVFVSKSEVARWPGIGWLARATGTIFIRRDPRDAGAQRDLLRGRLADGQRMVIFPEGTSSDGRRVLPFKSSLFAAFLAPETGCAVPIQPVTVIYEAPASADPRAYGWWGDMAFGPHLLSVMAADGGGRVTLVYHPPLDAAGPADRKRLARAAETVVRAELERRLQGPA